MDKYGTPGFGKSRALLLMGKPKWMPLWLHRWREKRAWLRWRTSNTVIVALGNYEPSDLALPTLHKHTVAPRPWPKKEEENDDA